MLENIVAWVLNNYIGEYLEDLNTDQLSVALLSGQVELDNVPLKKSALRKLDLPLEVKSGLLGKLTLSVPITHMRSEPWTLKLSDVLIIVGPPSSDKKYDVEAVEQVEQQKKESMLAELELKHKNELLTMMNVPIPISQNSWWGASLISTVLNNIQLILSNVHIRYEDGTTLPNGLPFNCGVRIQNMTMQTTNTQWKPGFVEPIDGVNIFKKLELNGFSIYWNSNQDLTKNIDSPKLLRDILAPENPSNTYIIHPCSAELRMERNSSKFPLQGSNPRFKFFLRPEKITCELTRRQMAELRAVNREWVRFERARQHRKWRPLTSVGADARSWWRFAYERVSEDARRSQTRKTWSFALTRARHLNAYCRAYYRRLQALINNPTVSDEVAEGLERKDGLSTIGGSSQEHRTIMKQIERDAQYSYHELHLFRETVFRRLMKEKERERGIDNPLNEDTFETIDSPTTEEVPVNLPGEERKDEGKGLYGWITSFFTAEENKNEKEKDVFDFGNVDLSDLKKLPKSFNFKEMEDEILDVLHESWDDSTLLRRDNLLAEVSLRLQHLTLRFIDTSMVGGVEQRRVLAMDLTGVNTRLELSPKQHSLSVSLSVHDMSIQRLRTGHPPPKDDNGMRRNDDSFMCSLAESTKILLAVGKQDCDDGTHQPIFKMLYRRRAPRLIVRHSIEGSFRPISVMYEENALAGLSSLFADDPVFKKLSTEDTMEDLSMFESHIFVSLHMPKMKMELRRRGWGGMSNTPEWEAGEPFACVAVDNVAIGIVSREMYHSKVKIGIGHMEMTDLLENSAYPLLSSGTTRPHHPCSNSCPDIAGQLSNSTVISSSLPNSSFLAGMAGVHTSHDSTRRKLSGMDGPTDQQQQVVLLMDFADNMHPQFESKYNKNNCNMEVTMDEMEIGVNRRTWTALLDLAGLLGVDERDEKAEDVDLTLVEMPKKEERPFCIGCSVRSSKVRIDMHYPANNTKLGAIHLMNIEILSTVKLQSQSETVSLAVLMEGMRIDDRTPLYSELYPERVILIETKQMDIPSRAQFHIVKYLGEDSNRDCDLRLQLIVPDTMHLYYVHTHRYFCGLMDFWMQFFELQDQVAKSKKIHVVEGARSRVSLNMEMKCPTTLILPMNQCSHQAIVMEAKSLIITNTFQPMSQVESIFNKYSVEREFGYDKDVDCLLDCIRVVLSDLKCYESLRVELHSRRDDANSRVIGRGIFDSYEMLTSRQNVFSKTFDLNTDLYRNLDGCKSHNAPDLTIITGVSGLGWKMTTDFYVLFRGFLEKNLGDPLITVPETIPIEILHKPVVSCEVGSDHKYSTLSFRLMFEDVELDCQVPCAGGPHPLFASPFTPFASVHLTRARISFDVYIDGQSELDLICESTQLIDTRKEQSNGQKNCFPIILEPRDQKGKKVLSLMSEAHLLLKKDEPPALTLVLMNSRVVLLPDWLNDLKEFVLLSTDFIPKYSDEPTLRPIQWKDGVVGRTPRSSAENVPQQTVSLKITLRDSDLLLIENPCLEKSFALTATTTAVLNMNDAGGVISANLEIQSMILGWCAMQSEETTRNQCSNEFSIGIHLGIDRDRETNGKVGQGLPQLSATKHKLEIELKGMIGRLSYKDFRVVRTVLDGYLKNVEENIGKTVVPIIGKKPPPKSVDIGKIDIKTEHADLWLLDDFQGSSIPLLRLSLSNVNVEKIGDRLAAAFTISADYFNQRVFGWEPLLEKWSILRFLSTMKDQVNSIELITETKSTLDVNVTEQLMQQAMQLSQRWPSIKESVEREDFRTTCIRSRSHHLPYLLKNETGCDLTFTTAVEDILSARQEQRKASVRWMFVGSQAQHTFEFPARLLLYSHCEREPPRRLIVRVDGWDEISPVNVDACGTYFRLVKAVQQGKANARLVIRVTMEKDGKKVVALRSSIDIHNHLPHSLAVYVDDQEKEVMVVESDECLPVPLRFVNGELKVSPVGSGHFKTRAELAWKKVRLPGEVLNRTITLEREIGRIKYWLCTSVRREHYPEVESLPGHSVYVVAPLTVQNLLPIDVEFRIGDQVFALAAGKKILITTVDIRDIRLSVTTDRMSSVTPCVIYKSNIGEGQIQAIRMQDSNGRYLDMYGNVHLERGGAVSISLWVPYWIVNKSGIPLVLKQEAADSDAAGQMAEHETAKDRHPLMFSFADEGCPKQCMVRVGNNLVREAGYKPKYSQRFPLVPGVQALKLKVVHDNLTTIFYNVGVEVRAGTGRYKDTQVVLLTSRYLLNNQSTHTLSVCHHDLIDRPTEYVTLAPQSNLVWNEKYEDRRMLRVRRADVRHWSFPFYIDRIGSFHVTMRDADETPRFVRVEIILNSAVFCVTFTDAEYYPPQIQIDNRSDVPVLYQQQSESLTEQHLRTICKANSYIDYAWDDVYGIRRIVLQVYENKSHVYDPSLPGAGAALVYENHMYIQLAASFQFVASNKRTEECELVLETLQKGKVMLNKQNRMDGNGGNQLWKLGRDGCIENVGINGRYNRTRMVLDVLERTGYQLMMVERNQNRDKYQKWTLMPDGRLCSQANPSMMVTAKRTEVCLATVDTESKRNEDGQADTQVWRIQRQRPGSGTLDVECMHNGPTLVVRITDRENKMRSSSVPVQSSLLHYGLDLNVTMRSGFGISFVNGLHEELIYARMGGIVFQARKMEDTYCMTGSVDVIQVDNQLLSSDRWQVLFCQPEMPSDEEQPNLSLVDLPPGVPATARPALKLEMRCTPKKHYDAFDCFRLKLCEMSVQLDELLLWKLVQFAQASDAAASVQQKTLSLPPNTELERPDPLRTRRWYFGTLALEMGQISLSVVTVAKSGLPIECRQLKQQFNVKLVSFENATVSLPPFRQFHYFETSSFLLESLHKFYFAELQKQTLNIVVTLDAFGNPLGLVTDLKDSFQGLFIEGDVQRFVAGLGYGVSNSISKMASSAASGVGALTFDQEHEAKRRHNMIRSHSTSLTPLNHLFGGVKGLGVGVLGGATAIFTNTLAESRKSGLISGALRGITTGAVDTFTKPVQGLFDLVEGTASAMKELAAPGTSSGGRRSNANSRVRPPRLCRNLYHLLPPYSLQLASAQAEMMRINGYSSKERLLDVEVCLEQLSVEDLIRQYVLISTKQCYVCRQVNDEPSTVIQRFAYKLLKSVHARPELTNTLACIEVNIESEDRRARLSLVWCSRMEVARRLADKMLRAKHEYDHSKRTLNEARDKE